MKNLRLCDMKPNDKAIIKAVESDSPAIKRMKDMGIETGEKIESFMDLLTVKPDMQQLGSAVTYARRYSLLPMLNIECEDDDGNLASGKTKTFNELETFEDFDTAIRSCKSEKAVNALWYKWREKFAIDSDEYKKLAKTSSDMKTKLSNPNLGVQVR